MAEADCGCKYDGCVPIADLVILASMDGLNRRAQGADFAHEFLRLGAAEDRGKMNQAQSLGYRIALESGSGRTRSETNRPSETSAAAPAA